MTDTQAELTERARAICEPLIYQRPCTGDDIENPGLLLWRRDYDKLVERIAAALQSEGERAAAEARTECYQLLHRVFGEIEIAIFHNRDPWKEAAAEARRTAIEGCKTCVDPNQTAQEQYDAMDAFLASPPAPQGDAVTFAVTISEGRRRTISATIFADDWLDAAKQLHSILYQQSCVETQARPLSRFTKVEMQARDE